MKDFNILSLIAILTIDVEPLPRNVTHKLHTSENLRYP